MSEEAFVELCLQGRATLNEIDDYIDAWNESTDPRTLHEFLGMSWDEYRLWVERPASLRHILFARRATAIFTRARDVLEDAEEYRAEHSPAAERAE